MDKATLAEAQSGLNPQGPSQPNLNTVYEVKGNAADKEPVEQATAQANSTENGGSVVDQRIPTKQTSYVSPYLSASWHWRKTC